MELETIDFPDSIVEVLPPGNEVRCGPDVVRCLCCGQARPRSWLDDDGCGICEECIPA